MLGLNGISHSDVVDAAQDIAQLPLDTLLLEGDNATWNLDDWDWDPYQVFAEPKDQPSCYSCQALKRHRPNQQAALPAHLHGLCPHTQQAQHALQQQLTGPPQHFMNVAQQPQSYNQQLQQQLLQQLHSSAPSLPSSNSSLPLGFPNCEPAHASHPTFPAPPGLTSHSTFPATLDSHHHSHSQPPSSLSMLPPLSSLTAQQRAALIAHLTQPPTQPSITDISQHSFPTSSLALQPPLPTPTPSLSPPTTLPYPVPHHTRAMAAHPQSSPTRNNMPVNLLPTSAPSAPTPAPAPHPLQQPQPPPNPIPSVPSSSPKPHLTFTDYIRELCAAANSGRATNNIAPLLLPSDPQPAPAAAPPAAGPAPKPRPVLSLPSAYPPQNSAPHNHSAPPTSQPAAYPYPVIDITTAKDRHSELPHLGRGGQESGGSVQGAGGPDPDKDTAGSGACSLHEDVGKPTCQVEGCARDLTHLKDYHQRYRICDIHIKLPQVMKSGRLQRFCQQCGRFHELAAFDGIRKSCRAQLSKHNARRRRRTLVGGGAAATGGDPAFGLGGEGALGQKADEDGGLNENAVEDGVGTGMGAGSQGQGSDAVEAAGLKDEEGTAAEAADGSMEVGRILQSLMSNPSQLQAMRLLLGVQTHPALPPQSPLPTQHTRSQAMDAPDAAPPSSPGASAAGASTYSIARDMMAKKGACSHSYSSNSPVMRLSMKLFNRTPADLPSDLRGQLTGWLSSAPPAMEGYIRPGCVFLTFNMLLDATTHATALESGPTQLIEALLASDHPCWTRGVLILQLFHHIVVVADGRVVNWLTYTPAQVIAMQLPIITTYTPCILTQPRTSPPPLPSTFRRATSPLAPATPTATTRLAPPSAPAQTFAAPDITVTIEGHNFHLPDCQLIVREAGRQLEVDTITTEYIYPSQSPVPPQKDAAADMPDATVRQVVRIKGSSGCGVIFLEFARGAFLSEAKPLLVLDDAAAAAELNALPMGVVTPSILTDLGLLLQHGRPRKPLSNGSTPLPTPRLLTVEQVPAIARRLLLFACDHALPHLAMMLLPLSIDPTLPAADAVADAIQSPLPDDPLTLLHHAVRSDSLELLQAVLHWGLVHKYQWCVDGGGPSGVSALHLAALKEDDGAAVMALMDHCDPDAFTTARADDGVTPFHLGFQMGHFGVNRLLPLLLDLKDAHITEQPLRNPPASIKATAARMPPAKKFRSLVPCCHYCLSDAAPLLLQVSATCLTCATRRPCLPGNGADRCCSAEELAGVNGQQPCDFCSALSMNPLFDICGHDCATRYNIKALCLGCHSSRCLDAY